MNVAAATGRHVGLAIAFVALAAGCAAPPPLTFHDEAVIELRAVGRFDQALEAARADLARQSRAWGVPAWRVTNARLDVATLERIVALPDSARRALAGVESTVPARVGAGGDWRTLLPALERQLAVRTRLLGEGHPDVADTRAALGRLEAGQGNPAVAHSHALRALEARRRAFGELHPAVVESYDQLGYAMKLAGLRLQDADSLYDRAIRLGRRIYPRGSPELATAVLHAANFARTRGRPDRCDRLFAEALRLRRAVLPETSAAVAEVLSDWAVTCAYFEDDVRAARLSRQAVAILDRPGAADDGDRTLALETYGKSLLRSGRPAEALPLLLRAVEAQERRWRAARRDQGRSRTAPLTAWLDVASARLALGDSVAAFETCSRAISRGVLERAMERGALDPGDCWTGLLDRVRRVLPDTTAMVGWLQTPVNDMVGDPFWCWVIRRESGIHWVRVKRPRPSAFGGFRPTVGWRSTTDLGLGWLRGRLTAAGAWPVRVEMDPMTDSLASAIYDLRIAPIEPWLAGIRELVVVSPDVHQVVPIELLHAPGGPAMLDRFVIGYVPSAVLYAVERERIPAPEDPRRWRTLVMGATDPRPGRKARRSLVAVADEVRDVRRATASARVLQGATATEAEVRRLSRAGELERFDLIHVAAHQRTDRVFTDDTGIVLAEAYARPPASLADLVDEADGRLTPHELEEMRLDARLVVLASCNSLGSRYTRTEGAVGLGSAALRAGAHSVLVSTWNVDDRATHLMVERFYRELTPASGRPRTFAEALRIARLELRDWRAPDGSRPYAHPAYWAGFALLGAAY